ncbi:MAG: beta-ketoacyl synthase chain length factor [Tannerellaceae bacterium]|jgi:3-oxoacyl-(acyl-carrier-protein) synthase|nr:beta-ketoacyl synthase chain length factor [Tannerellaceae bacterium]
MKDVYILAAKHISAQSPLCEEWMDNPVSYTESYVRAADPDYTRYFAPNTARRLGKILKRAMLTSRQVMQASGISQPDAIITATGLGCIENTECFLDALTREGESLLKPTCFMQSTHNTISSLIAIDAHCCGYNSTYSHKGTSFECALLDAFMQLENGSIRTALVGAHDEMTPNYFKLLKRIGYLGHSGNGFSSETAISLMLATEPKGRPLCRLLGIEMRYGTDREALRQTFGRFLQQASVSLDEIDAVMIGTNGQLPNDRIYAEICPVLFPGKHLLRYKHLFGESYTAPGLGLYAAAVCLDRQRIPAHLLINAPYTEQRGIGRILLYNQFENQNHSLILLSSCGK